MACKREARKRHNTIAFWLSDEERMVVDARIKIAGISKGEYYRSSVLGQQVNIVAGRYKSDRLAMVLEDINKNLERGDAYDCTELKVILQELLEVMRR